MKDTMSYIPRKNPPLTRLRLKASGFKPALPSPPRGEGGVRGHDDYTLGYIVKVESFMERS